MTMSQEFHYRLPHRAAGWRPGSHRGSTLGAGLEFASHASLYDR
ncbi:MAG: MxaS protein, partial [Ideonella sp.]